MDTWRSREPVHHNDGRLRGPSLDAPRRHSAGPTAGGARRRARRVSTRPGGRLRAHGGLEGPRARRGRRQRRRRRGTLYRGPVEENGRVVVRKRAVFDARDDHHRARARPADNRTLPSDVQAERALEDLCVRSAGGHVARDAPGVERGRRRNGFGGVGRGGRARGRPGARRSRGRAESFLEHGGGWRARHRSTGTRRRTRRRRAGLVARENRGGARRGAGDSVARRCGARRARARHGRGRDGMRDVLAERADKRGRGAALPRGMETSKPAKASASPSAAGFFGATTRTRARRRRGSARGRTTKPQTHRTRFCSRMWCTARTNEFGET